jgi:hypothetical protein
VVVVTKRKTDEDLDNSETDQAAPTEEQRQPGGEPWDEPGNRWPEPHGRLGVDLGDG